MGGGGVLAEAGNNPAKDLLEVCNNSARIGQDTYDGECRLVGLRQSRWAYGQRTLECGYP